MRYARTVPILLLASALWPRPAIAAPNKEHLQIMAEIRMLQEQQQLLQASLVTLQDSLKAVSSKLDDQASAERKALADQTLALTNIRDTVRTLAEKADETNVRISSVLQEVEALRQAIASQPPIQTAGAPGATPPGTGQTEPGGAGTQPSPPTGAAPTTAAPPIGVSLQRMYDGSFDDYTAGRYDLAITGFKEFINTFGQTPKAADAQFNIGKSYEAQNKYSEARDAFQAVITNYPQQATVVPDAYYELGQTYEKLNQIDEAKRAYDTVVQKFPSSSSYNLARQALDRLSRK
ncbi:MAG: tol-pal system protein YbgF [Vicinamibacterales bacterium]